MCFWAYVKKIGRIIYMKQLTEIGGGEKFIGQDSWLIWENTDLRWRRGCSSYNLHNENAKAQGNQASV